jgi:hypothetical protein
VRGSAQKPELNQRLTLTEIGNHHLLRAQPPLGGHTGIGVERGTNVLGAVGRVGVVAVDAEALASRRQPRLVTVTKHADVFAGAPKLDVDGDCIELDGLRPGVVHRPGPAIGRSVAADHNATQSDRIAVQRCCRFGDPGASNHYAGALQPTLVHNGHPGVPPSVSNGAHDDSDARREASLQTNLTETRVSARLGASQPSRRAGHRPDRPVLVAASIATAGLIVAW